MDTIVEKLDLLDEYHSQKDSIDAQKRALLDDVKVPAEVIQVMNDGNVRIQAYEENQRKAIEKLRAEIQAKLDAIKIPDEIRLAYEDIAHQRELITAFQSAKQLDYQAAVFAKRNEIQAEMEAQTREVYAALARRKQEIEAEFHGKIDAVNDNIKTLEAEIKAETKAEGKTVKGKYFIAVYVKGKVTWNTDMLDGMLALVPQLSKARKEGDPSITLRRV